jgi:hypothetical protein
MKEKWTKIIRADSPQQPGKEGRHLSLLSVLRPSLRNRDIWMLYSLVHYLQSSDGGIDASETRFLILDDLGSEDIRFQE